ncbi:thiamine diphosphokinase [Bacillus seohaeanensis]|uniref:Thiamine diphosphokinase n=1 Tax=Bacillus seohaeanensis TaxID=284580 RepID=A0ABW5RWN5_9BACI
MNIHILAGGPLEYIPKLSDYCNGNVKWVGVDRGVFTLIEQEILPYRAFGDFDSVTPNEWDIIEEKVSEINRYTPEKDETDLELALNWAMEQKPDLIRIFGATGGRLDHFMGNVQLLINEERLNDRIKIEIIDSQNTLSVVMPGTYPIDQDTSKDYVSFVPVSSVVENLTLIGFKYPLKNRNIFRGTTLCISNELIQSSGTFSFTNGILMVIRSRD